MMLFFGLLDAEKGWTKQFISGARRTTIRGWYTSSVRIPVRFHRRWPQADALASYLDRLDQENALPKMVITT